MDPKELETPGSDAWWVARLMRRLGENAREAAELRAWLEGSPPLAVPDNERPNFERLQRIANVNLAGLIVDARLHRMELTGARTRVDDSANGDDVLAQTFVEQGLSYKLASAFRWALGEGRGYLILTAEGDVRAADALHAVVERDADGNTVAALSIHRDDVNNRDVAILARPGYFRTAVHEGQTMLPKGRMWVMSADAWKLSPPIPSGLDFVPAYELSPPGGSLIKPHLSSLQRINHGILQRMVIIAMQAFRQRGLKGAPDKDENGNEIDYSGQFESAPDSLWLLPEGVDVWESGQADIQPVLLAVRDDIKFLAAASKTPLFLISPDDANGSATGADTQREIITFDVKAIEASFEGTLKRMLSDLLMIRGEVERADISGIRLLWANPQRSSISERAQAALAASQAGIPFRMRMEKFAELTPDEVEEAERQRADDLLLGATSEVA